MKKKLLIMIILIVIATLSIPIIIFGVIINEQEISKQLTEEEYKGILDYHNLDKFLHQVL